MQLGSKIKNKDNISGSFQYSKRLVSFYFLKKNYRQVSNIGAPKLAKKIVDNSDVVGASPVGAAPTTSELST